MTLEVEINSLGVKTVGLSSYESNFEERNKMLCKFINQKLYPLHEKDEKNEKDEKKCRKIEIISIQTVNSNESMKTYLARIFITEEDLIINSDVTVNSDTNTNPNPNPNPSKITATNNPTGNGYSSSNANNNTNYATLCKMNTGYMWITINIIKPVDRTKTTATTTATTATATTAAAAAAATTATSATTTSPNPAATATTSTPSTQHHQKQLQRQPHSNVTIQIPYLSDELSSGLDIGCLCYCHTVLSSTGRESMHTMDPLVIISSKRGALLCYHKSILIKSSVLPVIHQSKILTVQTMRTIKGVSGMILIVACILTNPNDIKAELRNGPPRLGLELGF
jgi:hypothetical protein